MMVLEGCLIALQGWLPLLGCCKEAVVPPYVLLGYFSWKHLEASTAPALMHFALEFPKPRLQNPQTLHLLSGLEKSFIGSNIQGKVVT